MFGSFAKRMVRNQIDTLNKLSLDLGQKFEGINESLFQLVLNLVEININKGLISLVKVPAPPLGPMPVKRTRTVTVIVTVTNLKPMLNQTTSKKEIKRNCYSHSPANVSLQRKRMKSL